MSEKVLHEWDVDGSAERLCAVDIGGIVFMRWGKSSYMASGVEKHCAKELARPAARVKELARLAARVAELEGEKAKLHDAILDLYNAHQDEALEIRMRECGRWTEIRALVGEANDRAARAEVKL